MPNRSPGLLAKLAKTTGVLALTAIGGWIVYSRIGVDHQAPLPDALDAPRKQFTSTRGGRMNYYFNRPEEYAATDGGANEGRPLVLIHSINAAPSAIEMKPLFAHYRTQRPVFALDLPGFGLSARNDRRYTPELYADAIMDFLISEVGLPADVIAYSLSSEFAARVALARPDLFHSLVLISPTGLGERTEGPSAATAERIHAVLTFPLWKRPLYDLLTTRRSIRYFLGIHFVGETPEALIEYAYATTHQPGAPHAPFYFLSTQLFTWDIRTAVYAKLDVPTLILFDRDPDISFDMLPQLVNDNPRVQAERITPTLGLPHWEKPAETAAALDAFWASVGAE